MYVMRKHRGIPGVFHALVRIAFRMLNPLNILSARYRRKTIHMTLGSMDALKQSEQTSLRNLKEAL
jgi:hypothetical protein